MLLASAFIIICFYLKMANNFYKIVFVSFIIMLKLYNEEICFK